MIEFAVVFIKIYLETSIACADFEMGLLDRDVSPAQNRKNKCDRF